MAGKRTADGDASDPAPKKALTTSSTLASASSVPNNKTMPTNYSFIEKAPSGCCKIVTFNVNSLAASCKKGFK
ncbi:hypothetical protein GGH18_003378, partial [Coemansia sp. RSA 530]